MKKVNKLKDDARRHELREDWDKAIQAYQRVLEMGESEGDVDLPLYNRVGDLYVRVGRPNDAVRYYAMAADRYADAGLFNNAIALCNKALRYGPDNLDLLRKLGQFSASQGFLTDARRWFLEYAENAARQGRADEALEALREFANSTEDAEVRELFGRTLKQHGRDEEAVSELRHAYRLYLGIGDSMRSDKLAEYLAEIAPDVSLAGEMPEHVVREREENEFVIRPYAREPEPPHHDEPDRTSDEPDAATEVEDITPQATVDVEVATDGTDDAAEADDEDDVEDDAALEGLVATDLAEDATADVTEADVLEGFQPTSFETEPEDESAALDLPELETVDAASEADDVTVELPDLETTGLADAADTEVADDLAVDALPDLESTALADDEEPAEEPPTLDDDEDVEPLPMLDDEEDVEPLPMLDSDEGGEPVSVLDDEEDVEPLPTLDSDESVEPVSVPDDEEDVEPLPMLDSDESVEPVSVPGDEEDVEPLPMLDSDESVEPVTVLDDEEDVEPTVDDTATHPPFIVDAVEGADAFVVDEIELPMFEDTPDEVADIGEPVVVDEPEAPTEATPLPATEPVDIAEPVTAEEASESEPPVEERPPIAVPEPVAMQPAEPPSLSTDGVVIDDADPPAVEIDHSGAAIADVMSAARAALARHDAAGAVGRLLTLHQLLDSPAAYARAAEAVRGLLTDAPAEIRLHQVHVELAERSGDRSLRLDAYLALGQVLEATDSLAKAAAIYEHVLEIDPSHATARTALDVLAERRMPQYVDLKSLLDLDEPSGETRYFVTEGTPSGDEDDDFAAVLRQFKQKISEHVAPEDAEAHYDLGLAFREMGLLDEAIEQFQIALRTGDGRLKVYEELGGCFVQKEQYSIAVKLIERALQIPAREEMDRVGLYYYLGAAHERLGSTEQARDAYERVLGLDMGFRDVTERLARL